MRVGTVNRVLQMLRLPDRTIKVLSRDYTARPWDRTTGILTEDDIQMVQVTTLPDLGGSILEGEAIVRAMHEAIEEYAQVNRKLAKETILAITSVEIGPDVNDAVAI